MSSRLSLLLPVLLGGCLLSGFAEASTVTVNTGASKPTSNLYLSAGPSAATGQNTGWSNVRDLGQTFSVNEAIFLQSVTFRIDTYGAQAPGAVFAVNIYAFSSKSASEPDGAAIYTGLGTIPATLVNGEYLTITLDTPQKLSADQYYGLVLSFSEPVSGRQISLFNSTTSPANLGTTVTFQSNAWGSRGTPIEMYVVGEAIPEPSVAWISLLGGGLILKGRGRRFRAMAHSARP